MLLPSAASAASAAGASTVVPVTTFTVTSSQCDGPTYLPVLDPALFDLYGTLDELVGLPPEEGRLREPQQLLASSHGAVPGRR